MRAGLVRSIAVSLVASMIGVTASAHLVRASQPSYFDQAFGINGVSTIEIPPRVSPSNVDDIQVDATGRLLTLLNVQVGLKTRVAIGRRTTELVVDTSFGSNGVTDPINLNLPSMLLEANGKILLAGIEPNGRFGKKITVRQYQDNGKIDQSFGEQSVAIIADLPGKGFESGPLLSMDALTGRIILAITTQSGFGAQNSFYFFSLDQEGNRWRSWGYDGGREIVPSRKDNVQLCCRSYLTDILALDDGSLIAVGVTTSEEYLRQIVLIKFNPWGALDTTFDGRLTPENVGNGIVTESFGYSDAYMSAITILNNGNIAVSGGFGSGGGSWTYGAAQFNAVDGTPVSTFGTMGSFNTGEPLESFPRRVLQTGDGDLIFPAGKEGYATVIRINSDGTSFHNYVWTIGFAKSKTLQLEADGTFVLGGQFTDGGNDALIARMSLNGSPMTGPTGYKVDQIRFTHVHSSLTKSLPQSNGAIIALLNSHIIDTWGWESEFRPVIARLTNKGAPDLNFGMGGFSEFTPPDHTVFYFASDVVVQPDGKIVILVNVLDNSQHRSLIVWRLLSNGQTDEDFGTLGQVAISMDGTNVSSESLVLVENSKMLLAGELDDGSTNQSWLFKLNPNGSADTFFRDGNNIDGRVKITFGEYECSCTKVTSDAQGRYLVSGHSYLPNQSNAVMARYLPNGQLDPDFSDDGFVTFSLSPFSVYRLKEVHVTATGDIVAIAESRTVSRASVLMRIRSDGTLDTSFNKTGLTWFKLAEGSDDTATSVTASDTGYTAVGEVCERDNIASCKATFARIGMTGELDSAFGTNGISIEPSLGAVALNQVVSINDSYQLVSGMVVDANGNENGILIRLGNSLSAPPSSVPVTTVPATTVPVTTVPATTVPVTTVSVITVPITTVPEAAAAVAPKIAQAVPLTTQSAPMKLVIAVSQATILKNMKLTVPKGGVATFSIATSSTKVCKVVKKQVMGTAIGTCRVSVTIKTTSKKSVTKWTAFKVSG